MGCNAQSIRQSHVRRGNHGLLRRERREYGMLRPKLELLMTMTQGVRAAE